MPPMPVRHTYIGINIKGIKASLPAWVELCKAHAHLNIEFEIAKIWSTIKILIDLM